MFSIGLLEVNESYVNIGEVVLGEVVLTYIFALG
jgi:hypothetical protein